MKNSKHGFHFCSRKCKEQSQSMDGNCPEIRPSHYGTSNGKEVYLNLIKKAECPTCVGCSEGAIYLLNVHHINGNRLDNPRDGSNFEIVCANCHKKRHLKQRDDGTWFYWTASLTPRNILSKL